MNKFKVGEKIRVYQGRDRYTGYVSEILFDDSVKIEELDVIFNPKQCRKLKPKRKPREFWLLPCGPNNLDALDHDPRLKHPNANWNGLIHVREVIGKGVGNET